MNEAVKQLEDAKRSILGAIAWLETVAPKNRATVVNIRGEIQNLRATVRGIETDILAVASFVEKDEVRKGVGKISQR